MNIPSVAFAFEPNVVLQDVEDTLGLAILTVQSIFGENRVGRELRVRADRTSRSFLIGINNDVGRFVATIFAGLIRREFGVDCVGGVLDLIEAQADTEAAK